MNNRKLIKIKDLAPKQRRQIFFLSALYGAMCLISIGMLIYYRAIGDPYKRTANCVNTALAVWLPFVAERLLKHRFSFVQHLVYAFIMLTSCVIGSVFYVFEIWAPYDKLAHGTSGYLIMIFILGIFVYFVKDFDKINAPVSIMMIFAFSLGTACAWEVIEFLFDWLLGQNGQGYVSEEILQKIAEQGYSGIRANFEKLKYVGVLDTDTDMAVHTLGSLIFSIHYLIHRLSRRNLLMGTIIKDAYATEMNTAAIQTGCSENGTDSRCRAAESNETEAQKHDCHTTKQ